ncbi:MAG: DNA (cytosine-5-)-methyltransferase [Tannerellaceae bacterium]|nr:DNA (cytosine-5-)-methyltransferase [Tannerellaceae bacterium]
MTYLHHPIKHASLFSGFGAPDLAATLLGWENIFHCEIDYFCNQILKYYFPNSISYENIIKTDFSKHRGQIDVLTGGFPCQPFSVAGSRKGKNDDRYLWPEMLRAIREIRPTWIIGENVAGITSMVQPGSEVTVESQTSESETDYTETLLEQEFVIETICRDLECEGYSVQPIIIPACAVGAPHRRERVWFIAYNTSNTTSQGLQERIHYKQYTDEEKDRERLVNRLERSGSIRVTSDSDSLRLERECNSQRDDKEGWEIEERFIKKYTGYDGRNFPTQSPVCSRDDGFSSRLDNITFPKWRTESIKGYGNAIVPPLILELFIALEESYFNIIK